MFFSLAVVALLSSCVGEDRFTNLFNENEYTVQGAVIETSNVVNGFFDLGDPDNASVGLDMSSLGAAVNATEVFMSYNGGESKSFANVSSLPSSLTITLNEALSAMGLNLADLAVGDAFALNFETSTAEGTFKTGKSFPIPVTCKSELAGMYDYSTENYFCEGDAVTGSVEIVESSAGVYVFSDWAFGTYQACYGGEAQSWGSLSLTDVCNTLTVGGLDNYGDTWSYSNLSVNGDKLTFTWENTYGESGTTTLTNPNGDWPPLSL